jgi:hypothetical protein
MTKFTWHIFVIKADRIMLIFQYGLVKVTNRLANWVYPERRWMS